MNASMKKTLAACLILMAAVCGTAAAQNVPSSDLLLPYFEVDGANQSGLTTLFAVGTGSSGAGKKPPRGIGVLDDGEWAVPVIFGVDAASHAAAVAFAIDHNNLTLLGGNLKLEDLLAIWDEEGLRQILEDAPDAGALLASMDGDDLDSLLGGPDFDPVAGDEQPRLDEKAMICCPQCGHEFRR